MAIVPPRLRLLAEAMGLSGVVSRPVAAKTRARSATFSRVVSRDWRSTDLKAISPVGLITQM